MVIDDRKLGSQPPGKLFYAVILTDSPVDFGSIGLDNQRVFSVNYKDIAALVSDYPRVNTIKLLRKNIAPYHGVIQESVKRFTTIPAKFAQIARDSGEVSIALQRNYGKIRRELERLEEKVEMGVKGWWTAPNILEYFVEKDPDLKNRRNLLKSKLHLNRMEQIDFGTFFHDKMDKARKQVTDIILNSLPASEKKLENISEDHMTTNALVLIRKTLQSELVEKIKELNDSMGNEFRLSSDGPWPPFSFVDHVEIFLPR